MLLLIAGHQIKISWDGDKNHNNLLAPGVIQPLLLHVFSSTKQTTATTNNLNRHHPNWTPLKLDEKWMAEKNIYEGKQE